LINSLATRMHGIDLWLYHRGQVIWNARKIPWEQIQDRREPYWGFRVGMPDQP